MVTANNLIKITNPERASPCSLEPTASRWSGWSRGLEVCRDAQLLLVLTPSSGGLRSPFLFLLYFSLFPILSSGIYMFNAEFPENVAVWREARLPQAGVLWGTVPQTNNPVEAVQPDSIYSIILLVCFKRFFFFLLLFNPPPLQELHLTAKAPHLRPLSYWMLLRTYLPRISF